MINFLRLLLIFSMLPMSLHPASDEDAELSRIRVSMHGQLEYIYITTGDLQLRIDGKGRLTAISVLSRGNVYLEPRLSNDLQLQYVNSREIQYRFITDGDIRSIGDTEIVFDPFFPDVLESVGSLKFTYHYIGDSPGMIKSIGDTDFSFRYPDDRLERAGGMIFHYYLIHGELLEKTEGHVTPDHSVELFIPTHLPAFIGISPDSLNEE